MVLYLAEFEYQSVVVHAQTPGRFVVIGYIVSVVCIDGCSRTVRIIHIVIHVFFLYRSFHFIVVSWTGRRYKFGSRLGTWRALVERVILTVHLQFCLRQAARRGGFGGSFTWCICRRFGGRTTWCSGWIIRGRDGGHVILWFLFRPNWTVRYGVVNQANVDVKLVTVKMRSCAVLQCVIAQTRYRTLVPSLRVSIAGYNRVSKCISDAYETERVARRPTSVVRWRNVRVAAQVCVLKKLLLNILYLVAIVQINILTSR